MIRACYLALLVTALCYGAVGDFVTIGTDKITEALDDTSTAEAH